MILLGHTRSQVPQPVQRSRFTTGRLSGPIERASKGQAFTHVPSPRHPIEQTLAPPLRSASALQSFTPSYKYLCERYEIELIAR